MISLLVMIRAAAEDAGELFGSGWGNYAIKGIVEFQLPEKNISLWPQTPGWLALALLLSVLVISRIAKIVRRYWLDRYRRLALIKLKNIRQQAITDTAKLRDIPELIKATALQIYAREKIASLHGEQWEQFLDQSMNDTAFSQRFAGHLAALSYGPIDGSMNGAVDDAEYLINEAFYQQLQRWIKHHDSELYDHTATGVDHD